MDMALTATVRKVLPNGNEDIGAVVLKLPHFAAQSKLPTVPNFLSLQLALAAS